MAVNSSPIPTHPPYQLIPHTNSTSVHTRVDQLNPTAAKALPTHPQRPPIPDQLSPSHWPSFTNSSPSHDHSVGYLICFEVGPMGSDCSYFGSVIKKHIYYYKLYVLLKKITCNVRQIYIQLKIAGHMIKWKIK